jgi:hypothetical protein
MPRSAITILMLLLTLLSPASGFDSYWHSEASRRVGDEFGFSEDARKIMQLGNFSPDFFGPVADFAKIRLPGNAADSMSQYEQQNAQSRQAAIFLHFDNLSGALDANQKFDFLFQQLLHNTQTALANFGKLQGVDDRTRKTLILITLGASLHAVQDFYSHSDWVHQDFSKFPASTPSATRASTSASSKTIATPSFAAGASVPLAQTSSGLEGLVPSQSAALQPTPAQGAQSSVRAPTWFEYRDKMGDPARWPFQIKTGLYPPQPGVLLSHTHMNHDNSRLIYKEYETPGQPVVDQAQYHMAGAVPAHQNDPASAAAHQTYAFNTAVAASSEWVRKIEENADARAAIAMAKTWSLKPKEPKLLKELDAGLAAQMALSCAAGKWDGEDPPGDRGVLCKTIVDQTASPSSATSAANIEAIITGAVTRVAFPLALKYTGKFWDVHRQYHILDALTQSIASPGGKYSFTVPAKNP